MAKVILISCLFLVLITVPWCSGQDFRQSVLNAIKDSCHAVSFNKYDEVSAEFDRGMRCAKNLLDMNEFESDMQRFASRGQLDKLFHKYCNVLDDVFDCFDSFSLSVEECLTAEQIKSKDKSIKVTKRMKEHACEEEGNKLARFFYESGPACVSDKQLPLTNCLEKVFPTRPTENLSFRTETEQCRDIHTIKQCVEPVLKTCEQDTAYKFIRDILDVFLEELSCSTNGADIKKISLTTILILSFLSIIWFKF